MRVRPRPRPATIVPEDTSVPTVEFLSDVFSPSRPAAGAQDAGAGGERSDLEPAPRSGVGLRMVALSRDPESRAAHDRGKWVVRHACYNRKCSAANSKGNGTHDLGRQHLPRSGIPTCDRLPSGSFRASGATAHAFNPHRVGHLVDEFRAVSAVRFIVACRSTERTWPENGQ